MAFAESTGGEKQPYKYNGKELDRRLQLNTYDYAARYLDNAVPRFSSVDPHAENYFSWSPYVYVGNNPMRLVDPNGKDWKDKVAGVTIGMATNAIPGTGSVRDRYTPNDSRDYNNTLQQVDQASLVIGVGMVIVGVAETIGGSGGGAVSAGPTAGLGALVGGAVAVQGVIVATDGAIIVSNSLVNSNDGYDRGKKVESGDGNNKPTKNERIQQKKDAKSTSEKNNTPSSESAYKQKNEHRNNQSGSNRETHEKGQKTDKMNQGGEKGDARRKRYK